MVSTVSEISRAEIRRNPSRISSTSGDRTVTLNESLGHWYVSNLELTLATVSATIPVLFSDHMRRYGVQAPFSSDIVHPKIHKS